MKDQTPNRERWKNAVVVLTIATTVIVAIVAGLQAEASIRTNAANRDSQFYSIKLAGELQRAGLQGNYDMAVFAAGLKDRLEATVLQLTAYQMKSQGNTDGEQVALLQAHAATARADVEQAASVFYADARYAPKSTDGTPDMQGYLKNLNAPALDLLAKQNKAADEYNKWNEKSDGYTAVLTILAIALFLFGLAQALAPRMRLLFAVFGVLATGSALLWVFAILLS